jgi:hypothetical protein
MGRVACGLCQRASLTPQLPSRAGEGAGDVDGDGDGDGHGFGMEPMIKCLITLRIVSRFKTSLSLAPPPSEVG